MDITLFKKLIRQKTGLDFNKFSSELLEYEIENILKQKGLASSYEYFELIKYNEKEFIKLLNLITVNETYFFREPQHIKILTQTIIPSLLKHTALGQKIKIVSAGCSTGEEPYSVAMALMEKFGEKIDNNFSVIGIDIDHKAIQKAQTGIYPQQSFRNMEPSFTKKYFYKLPNKKYQIKQEVKQNVTFTIANLLNEADKPIMLNSDVIFYRNVSIYFDKNIKKQILENLSQSLNEKGYLIVSSTETLAHDLKILPLIEIDNVFLFYKSINHKVKNSFDFTKSQTKKIINPVQKQINTFNQPKNIQKSIHNVKYRNIDDSFNKALSLAKTKEYKKALEIICDILNDDPSFIDAYVLQASIMINLNHIDQAKNIVINIIGKDSLSMEGYILLGIVLKLENKIDEAICQFKKALYLSASNWLTHFYLAELYLVKNNVPKALHEYQTVEKLISQGLFDQHGLLFFPFFFSEKDIMHLCKYNIDKIKASNAKSIL